jgi:hypothetical protein
LPGLLIRRSKNPDPGLPELRIWRQIIFGQISLIFI